MLFAGFSLAFFQLCTVTVIMVMAETSRKEARNIQARARNIQARMGVRSAKPSSQCCPIHQPKGAATMKHPINIYRYRLLNIRSISPVVLPNIFRMPISLRRYSLSNMVKPNTPMMLMTMASREKSRICLVNRSSLRYALSSTWSIKRK